MLLIADDDKVTVGQPVIEGAKVLATVQQHGKGEKIIVFKYKPKVRYRRKTGHRQLLTRLSIDKILPPGAAKARPVKRTRRQKTEVMEDGA